MRLWRNTGVASGAGQQGFDPGREHARVRVGRGRRQRPPPGRLIRMSSNTETTPYVLQDYGKTGHGHRHPPPGHVQGAERRPRLRSRHDPVVLGPGRGGATARDQGRPAADQRMQQATVNLFADMGVQPATLMSGPGRRAQVHRHDPTERHDHLPRRWRQRHGRPAGHNHRHRGRHRRRPRRRGRGLDRRRHHLAPGHHRARRLDLHLDRQRPRSACSGTGGRRLANLGPASSGPRSTPAPARSSARRPCRPRRPTPTPGAIELGVKFRADVDGFITGIRFYKGTGNTGTHIGSLWTARHQAGLGHLHRRDRHRLAAGHLRHAGRPSPPARPTSRPTSPPTAATPPTGVLRRGRVDTAPLHALPTARTAATASSATPAAASPTNTFGSTNYWVDVVFRLDRPDTSPPR